MGHAPGERAEKLAEAIVKATPLRTPSVGFDEIAKGGYKIERQIPLLPLSREVGRPTPDRGEPR
jgi:hypothetical protein